MDQIFEQRDQLFKQNWMKSISLKSMSNYHTPSCRKRIWQMLKDCSEQQYAIIICIGPVNKSIYWPRSKLYVYPAKSLGWITVGHPSSVLLFTWVRFLLLANTYSFLFDREQWAENHIPSIYTNYSDSHTRSVIFQ